MNFPPSKRGCIFSFLSKSEGYFEQAFTFNLLNIRLLKVKVKE